jgi:hypothetical protein
MCSLSKARRAHVRARDAGSPMKQGQKATGTEGRTIFATPPAQQATSPLSKEPKRRFPAKRELVTELNRGTTQCLWQAPSPLPATHNDTSPSSCKRFMPGSTPLGKAISGSADLFRTSPVSFVLRRILHILQALGPGAVTTRELPLVFFCDSNIHLRFGLCAGMVCN